VTIEDGLRIVAAASAVVAGTRGGRALFAAGALAGFAAFGLSAPPEAAPVAAGGSVLLLLGLLAASQVSRLSPVTEEAAAGVALFGFPAAAVAAVATRAAGPWGALAVAASVLASVSLFGAGGALASAEPGARRVACWAGALVLPAGLATLAAAELRNADRRGAVLAASVGLALLVWLPVIQLERRRVSAELAEEVRLGFLPAEDAEVLRWPWTRALEKRFGRPDERKEYVRSALLLAVARQQQRGRSGEAERLRQLEILTFRTRLRRTLEARAARDRGTESGEMPGLASAASPDEPGGA